MNSVEQKNFDNGILRLVGLNKRDYVTMIFTQALIFVLPSVTLGYCVSIPMIWVIYKYLINY